MSEVDSDGFVTLSEKEQEDFQKDYEQLTKRWIVAGTDYKTTTIISAAVGIFRLLIDRYANTPAMLDYINGAIVELSEKIKECRRSGF